MVNEKARILLEGEIERKFSEMRRSQTDTEVMDGAMTDLVTLYRLKIEEDKVVLEDQLKKDQLAEQIKENRLDDRFKQDQLAEQTIDRYFKVGTEAAAIVLPLIFYAVWMRRGFKFEETGSYTSTTFRNLFNRFRTTRR